MRGPCQLISLVGCSRRWGGVSHRSCRSFAVWACPSPEHRTLGQADPQHFNFAKDVLNPWARLEMGGLRRPTPALWEINAKGEGEKWNFARMTYLSQKAASILSDTCALGHGDQLMLLLPPIPEAYWIGLACVQLGITFVPGTTHLTAKEILSRVHMLKAQCIVACEGLAPLVDSVLPHCPTVKTKILVSENSYAGWLNFKELIRVAPPKQTITETKSQDPMAIFFTSRATGAPKLVEYSQYGLGMRFSEISRQWLDLQPTDVLWCLSDAFDGTLSLSNVLGAWLQGACVFLYHMPVFCPETVLKVLHNFPISTLSGNPRMYQELLQHQLFTSSRFRNLKHCVTAGASISLEVAEGWKRITKLDIYEGYGKTETGLLCVTSKRMKLKPGSLGKPLPPYIVQIVDENSNILPPGEEGNIAVHIKPNQPASLYCPHLLKWEENTSSRRNLLYLLGDRGVMDEDGYLWRTGGATDVIN